jgi:hypothetical protein
MSMVLTKRYGHIEKAKSCGLEGDDDLSGVRMKRGEKRR